MGLLGVVPGILRPAGLGLFGPRAQAEPTGRGAGALQRDPRQRSPRQEGPGVVAVAQPALRARQCERRLRFHLRRRVACHGKNPRARLHRTCLGQWEKHPSGDCSPQSIALRTSVLLRRRQAHATERGRFTRLRLATRLPRRNRRRARFGEHRR